MAQVYLAVWKPVILALIYLFDDFCVWLLPIQILGMFVPEVLSIMQGPLVPFFENGVFKTGWNVIIENIVLLLKLLMDAKHP